MRKGTATNTALASAVLHSHPAALCVIVSPHAPHHHYDHGVWVMWSGVDLSIEESTPQPLVIAWPGVSYGNAQLVSLVSRVGTAPSGEFRSKPTHHKLEPVIRLDVEVPVLSSIRAPRTEKHDPLLELLAPASYPSFFEAWLLGYLNRAAKRRCQHTTHIPGDKVSFWI